MMTQKATIRDLVFDTAIGAFEAQVYLESENRADSVTARAYLPMLTDEDTVRKALLRVAEKRHEALDKVTNLAMLDRPVWTRPLPHAPADAE